MMKKIYSEKSKQNILKLFTIYAIITSMIDFTTNEITSIN